MNYHHHCMHVRCTALSYTALHTNVNVEILLVNFEERFALSLDFIIGQNIEFSAIMVMQLLRNYWWAAITPAFGLVGFYLDKQQNHRYSGWKNRTQLYRRELKEGEDPWAAKS